MSSAREFDKRKSQPVNFEGAPRGMIYNAPHNDLPQGAVAKLVNAHAFPREFQPRGASWLYSDITPPVLTDSSGNNRSNYSASKSGTTITSESGSIFTNDDVSHYWVWPDDPAVHEEILERLSDTQVRVAVSEERSVTNGCWMRAKLNLFEFHHSMRKVVFQWGRDVYVADNDTISSWTRALCVSHGQPANAISDWSEMDDYGVFANSGGIFLIDFSTDPPLIFKKNTIIPSILPESTDRTGSTRRRYDYTYGMSRLSGTGIRDRTSTGVEILQQSGTLALNPNTDPPRDYAKVWRQLKISSGTRYQGRLVGGVMAAANQTPTYWQGQNDITYRLTVDGRTENFLLDMSATGYNVNSMAEVIEVMQNAARKIWPFITFEYADGQITITTEQEDSSIGYGLAGIGGTNHATIMAITSATAESLSNTYSYAGVNQVGILNVPRIPTDPANPEWHWTHYTAFRTEDIGLDVVAPRVDEGTNEDLPPIKFTWLRDIRVAGAFYASKDDTGLITAEVGEFERADEGTPFRWEDGDVDTLYDYIDSTHIMGRASSEPSDYYDQAKPLQAAAIGGGRVLRASQIGDIVTRTHGDLFTAADDRKPITWANGYYSYITEILDENRVRVGDTINKVIQGMTLDPIQRVFTDTVPDSTLRDRQGELHIGLLTNRFWTNLPEVNVLEVVPGFMLGAVRDSSDIYYSQLGASLKYLSGYHLETRQIIDRIEDNIQTIKIMPNMFIVFCSGSTWGGPTNAPSILELPEFGEAYATLYVDIIDKDIGVLDIGSIQAVDKGVLEIRCADNSWRLFNGVKYADDMTVDPETGQDRAKTDLKSCWNLGVSCYDENIGHIWWGRQR